MAQSGYAPIQLYYSSTTGHVPSAGNLVTGELAFNVADGAVYYKNLSNVVTQLIGLSGYSGYSGISGYSGFSGISGYSGFSGISGYSGFSGYSGATGSTGTGTSGYSGYSGYSGIPGSSILTTANNFTNTNTFATTVSIGSTLTPATLYVKGGNSNNLSVDNGGQQFTTLSLYNNGTEKAQMYWDQTNTLFVFGTDVGAPVVFKAATVERMRISTAGGVSIGTSTDAGVGNLLVNGTISGTTGNFSSTVTAQGIVSGLSPNSGSTGGIQIRDAAGDPDAVYVQGLNNAGNVGYATLKLNANGTVTPSGNIIGNVTGNATTATNASQFQGKTQLGLGITGEIWHGVGKGGNTTYTNTFSYPIMATFCWSCGGGSGTVTVTLDGATTIMAQGDSGNSYSYTFIVPPGSTYIANLSGTASIYSWAELF